MRSWFRAMFPPRSQTAVLIAVGLLGLLARFWLVTQSLGSNDIVFWKEFGAEIDLHRLGFTYDSDPRFNHPPLMALLVRLVYVAAVKTGMRFEVLFKTPQLLADALVAMLLYRMWRRRSARYAALAMALFCWNPASFLISAYHGNTDPLCVSLALAAVLAVDSESPLLAGLALGASINVKLIPVLLIPVLYSCIGTWRRAARFTFGLSFGVLPFVPVVVWHWQGFFAHALSYRGCLYDWWGITALLDALTLNQNVREVARQLHDFWKQNGSSFVLLAPLLLGAVNLARKRCWSARELGACTFCAFLVLTPGFGAQYVVYPVALLFAAHLGRALAFSSAVGLYVFVIYFSLWTHSQPYFSDFRFGPTFGGEAVGYLAWMVLVRTVIDLLRAKRRPPALTPQTSLLSSATAPNA